MWVPTQDGVSTKLKISDIGAAGGKQLMAFSRIIMIKYKPHWPNHTPKKNTISEETEER